MVLSKNALLLLTLAPAALSSTQTGTLQYIRRRQSVPTDLPGNWTSKGCWTDGGPRTLQGANYASANAMTVESCIAFCESKNFIYAGVEWSQECFCDNVIRNNAVEAPLAECNMACSGNPLQSCGAGGRLNLFWSGATPPPPPEIVPAVGNWKSLGCYTEGTTGRTLTVGMPVSSPLTIQSCTSACFAAGYGLSGAEYAAECFCGITISNGGAPAPAADCSMTCAGNSSQYCGGPNRLNLYNYTGTDLPPINEPPPPGGGDPGTPVYPVTNLPGNWKYKDCYIDNANGRILPIGEAPSQTLTIQSCIQTCSSEGYSVAGTQYSTECYCGNALLNGATVGTGCTMGCAGNTTQACGGPNRVSVYSNATELVVYPVPSTQTTGLPGSFKYAGCYTETPGAQRVFPYQIISKNLNVTGCMSKCAAFGYPASASQFGEECYCGDAEDLQRRNSVKVPDAECNIPCSGDPIHVCGGANRLTTYLWDGAPLTTWHKPAVTGRYEFWMPGVVVPLIATVGINNKVTFVEKWGTGFPNSTGAYELDPSLVPDMNKAYREMHVKTDVFCAASIILPDKAGRQLNVGGWSLESTFGVRLYTPSGTPGVNGTTDWEENYPALKLQRGRWYPTAIVMQNSSILVVGGEVGSNGAPEPSLEILPQPPGGPTWLYMDWLERTDPNNLYPFLQIIPNGDIFVAYYNEARILDKVTFATKKILPNIPGAVNDDTAGRTYPLEGAAVMLPQHAPYTDYLTFMVCGGSTMGAAIALDNCASIQIDAPNPKWVIERMPSKRVMSCMAALPDGTYLIVNGAHQGVAGFGLATDPNFSAVLYDPYKPVNARMSILNTTTIARMYHSEATLMPDARVLISGSDPQTYNPDGSEIFPEEFRLEMYTPPYLATGLKQPTFDLPSTSKDWAYGGKYTITNIKLFQGAMSGLRISLLAATSSTHGNTMGQRTIFPAFTCSGTSCIITAPPASAIPPAWHMLFILDGPTPSAAKWIRLGGDPAKLGNWPNLPGFTLPGV